VDADTVGLIDSADSNGLKKLSWANIKATLKAYFDTLYNLYVLPAPTTTALGGVMRNTGSAGQFVTGIAADGSLERGTPSGGGGGTPPTQALKTDTESTTSTTYADITGLTITVTPPSVTQSYILRAVLQIANGSAACFLRLAQDGVVIAQGDAAGLRSQMHVWVYHPGAYVTSSNVLEILVTPGTTSPVTFSVQWRSQTSGVAVFCNQTAQDDNVVGVPRMVSTLMLIPSP